jgi:hypothetical protein
MFRLFKRRKAIKSFIFELSLELQQRFGDKRFYSVEEIDQVLEARKYDRVFAPYAYALFCSQTSFDSYFNQLKVNCTYYGLRKFIARKYFRGVIDFDALSIVRFAKSVGDSTYYESNLGDPGAAGH